MAVAKRAAWYREHVEGCTVQQVATFERTAQQASVASALLQLTASPKSSLVFYGDGLLLPNAWEALQVLDCNRQACLCSDPAANCQYRDQRPASVTRRQHS